MLRVVCISKEFHEILENITQPMQNGLCNSNGKNRDVTIIKEPKTDKSHSGFPTTFLRIKIVFYKEYFNIFQYKYYQIFS